MIAYHFLKDDMTAGNGTEAAWQVGEERTIAEPERIVICGYGYHSSSSLWDALKYAPGSIATVVEIGEPVASEPDKYVSASRKLLVAVNIEQELRQFAIDCAERALNRERDKGREPDSRSWAAIEAAKAYLRGEITPAELAAARDAARAAACDAAWDAARAAEREWQRQRFDELVMPRIRAVCGVIGVVSR